MSVISWQSAREVCEAEPLEPNYLIEQLIVRGAITSISAKIKAGKTTLLASLMRSMLHEEPVIGLRAHKAKILYCTEEGPVSFARNLRRNHLNDEDNLLVSYLSNVPSNAAWPLIASSVLENALKESIDVVVFDTFTRWAKFRDNQENDAGSAAAAMEPIETMRKAGMSIIGVFHDRKSGGDIGDSSRGSSAFGGAADIILQLRNPSTNGHSNRRILESTGRLYDSVKWIMEWEKGYYRLIKSSLLAEEDEESDVEEFSENVERDFYKQSIIRYLKEETSLTMNQLALSLGIDPKSRTLRRAIDELRDAELIERQGSGQKGNPFTFALGSTVLV